MATKKDKKVATKVDATQITKVAAVGASAGDCAAAGV